MTFVIQNGVLEDCRFENMAEKENTTTLAIPEGVTKITKKAFRQNTAVRTVTLPESVRIIGAGAFSGCTALEEINLPETLTVLEENVFECCSSLKSIRFPAGITEIPPGICEECTGLEEVILPENTRTIRSSAFYNCTGLTEIKLPEHLERIYDSAFYCCEHIETFLLPDSLTEIDGYAFAGCRRLKSITLPGSLKILGRHCFRRCSDLQNIHVAPENRYFCSMDGVVCSKDGTLLYMVPPGKTELLLPETLTKIVPHILLGCEKLTVLRLHPDDTGICRQYHRVRDVESEIIRALEMIRTKKYTTQVHSAVKYPFIIQQYLREPDAVTAAYLRRCMTRIMTDAVRAGDLTGISALAGTEGLFTQTGIEKYLQLALKEKQPRIWAVLADYKHRHFGFAEKNDLL